MPSGRLPPQTTLPPASTAAWVKCSQRSRCAALMTGPSWVAGSLAGPIFTPDSILAMPSSTSALFSSGTKTRVPSTQPCPACEVQTVKAAEAARPTASGR